MNRDEVRAAVERLRHDVDVTWTVTSKGEYDRWFTLHMRDVEAVLEYVEALELVAAVARDLDDRAFDGYAVELTALEDRLASRRST